MSGTYGATGDTYGAVGGTYGLLGAGVVPVVTTDSGGGYRHHTEPTILRGRTEIRLRLAVLARYTLLAAPIPDRQQITVATRGNLHGAAPTKFRDRSSYRGRLEAWSEKSTRVASDYIDRCLTVDDRLRDDEWALILTVFHELSRAP